VIRYRFPGYFSYLHDAAVRLGHPEAEAPARRIAALAALANLCAQAGAAEPDQAPAILAKAAEFRDQLRIAAEAAERILVDTRDGLELSQEPELPRRPARSGATGYSTPRARHQP
jgi:hypothetical protein